MDQISGASQTLVAKISELPENQSSVLLIDLNFSEKTTTALSKQGIHKVADICQYQAFQFLMLPDIQKSRLEDIKNGLLNFINSQQKRTIHLTKSL